MHGDPVPNTTFESTNTVAIAILGTKSNSIPPIFLAIDLLHKITII